LPNLHGYETTAMNIINVAHGDYTITTDKSLMNVASLHKWLSEESYWNLNVPFDIVKKSFDHSYCIAAIKDGQQVAFARLITDYATFAYLADVYVLKEHRGGGLSKKMMELLFNLDWVKGLRGIKLQTKDAQELYRKYGFTECRYPERVMEISRPDIYTPNP
jgi:GNAT superfamily N-acetyltransferase